MGLSQNWGTYIAQSILFFVMTVKVPSLGITHLDTARYADLQMEFEKTERIDI